MYILYEEDGAFKVGAILTDNDTSLQVETLHGKRAKVKANSVLLRFASPGPQAFLDEAHAVEASLDVDFLWEAAGEPEFAFGELAQEYFGRAPTAPEAAGVLMRLHGAPMYFYRKGRGRYKPAPRESLEAAKASVERKRLQALAQAAYVESLEAFALPEAFKPQLETLIYRPDKNSIEYKALDEAARTTGLTPIKLLERCGAIASSHDYHVKLFTLEHFPHGTQFAPLAHVEAPQGLPTAPVAAFSIDDASTTEIDDAFSVSRLDNGHWQVGIHIAAPALGIAAQSPLDAAARSRLSTVYIPGAKITMLPPEAIGQFTLDADRACPALSMYLEIGSDFQVLGCQSRIERVPVAANLRHDTLETLFNAETLGRDDLDYPFRQELTFLYGLADALEALRGRPDANRGPQVDYTFTITGDRVAISPRRRGAPIDKVVSEMMIYVNSAWARLLAEHRYAAIYRCQDNGKVRMSTTPGRHVGLGVERYAWASSPLRRYVDLINQRSLIALLRGEAPPYAENDEALFAAMRDFEVAAEAYGIFQRTMERYWCLRYLQQEGKSAVAATTIKENIVRVNDLPLVLKVPFLPELEPGSAVLIEIVAMDLLEPSVECRFKEVLK